MYIKLDVAKLGSKAGNFLPWKKEEGGERERERERERD